MVSHLHVCPFPFHEQFPCIKNTKSILINPFPPKKVVLSDFQFYPVTTTIQSIYQFQHRRRKKIIQTYLLVYFPANSTLPATFHNLKTIPPTQTLPNNRQNIQHRNHTMSSIKIQLFALKDNQKSNFISPKTRDIFLPPTDVSSKSFVSVAS